MMFGLSPRHWRLLEQLVIAPLKTHQSKIWVFGSRARGDHREFSDIDILYRAEKQLPPGFLSKIKEAVEESDLADSYQERAGSEKVEV